LLLAGGAAWFSLRQTSWKVLGATLAHAEPAWLALALTTVLTTLVAKAVRWRVLLRPCGAQLGGMHILSVLIVGQMGNSLLPARLGDAARAVLLSPQAKGGIPAVVGTLLAEKALDGLMGLLILSGLTLWTPAPAWLRYPVLALAALTGALLVALVLSATQRGWVARLGQGLPLPPPGGQGLASKLPAGWQEPARRLLANLALGLGILRSPAAALQAVALSGMIWGLAALTNAAVAAALDLQAPGWSYWLVLVTVYTVTFLPAVPAQVGLFEGACILALTAAGLDREVALAFGLALHLLVAAPLAILGPIAMAAEGLSWRGLKRAGHQLLQPDGNPG